MGEQGLTPQICVFHPPDSFTTQTPSHKPEKELIWCLLRPLHLLLSLMILGV